MVHDVISRDRRMNGLRLYKRKCTSGHVQCEQDVHIVNRKLLQETTKTYIALQVCRMNFNIVQCVTRSGAHAQIQRVICLKFTYSVMSAVLFVAQIIIRKVVSAVYNVHFASVSRLSLQRVAIVPPRPSVNTVKDVLPRGSIWYRS